MSTVNRKKLPTVIVRSFGDQPVKLFAHRLDTSANRVFVGILEARNPLSLPVEDVYDFDKGTFMSLTGLYVQNNKTALAELYSEIRSKRPCNRYQNVLKSQHEKEPEVTNSGSPAESRQQ